MKNILPILLVFTIISSAEVFALPRFALKKGDVTCGGCHQNPMGGGLRTKGGESFSINVLPMWKRGDSLTGAISEGITLGADFRSQFLYFAQQYPLYNDFGVRIKDTTSCIKSFHAMSYAVELGVKATNTLFGYLRYDPLSAPAEGYAMLHFVHSSGELFQAGDVINDAYIKVGAFLPAYGIRFDDHTIYARGGNSNVSRFGGAGLFWGYGYRDEGGELGAFFFDHIGVQIGVYNGNESNYFSNFIGKNPNLAMSARLNVAGELVEDILSGEIGGSIYTHPRTDNTGVSVPLSLFAIHGGVSFGPVSVLAEYDDGKNIVLSGGSSIPFVKAITLEGSVKIMTGLYGMARLETFKQYADESKTILFGTEVKNRIMIGAQWFPLRFVEIRPEFRLATVTAPNISDPTIRDDIKQTTFLVQTHIFF